MRQFFRIHGAVAALGTLLLLFTLLLVRFIIGEARRPDVPVGTVPEAHELSVQLYLWFGLPIALVLAFIGVSMMLIGVRERRRSGRPAGLLQPVLVAIVGFGSIIVIGRFGTGSTQLWATLILLLLTAAAGGWQLSRPPSRGA